MVSPLDIYKQAYYWHVFVPAQHRHKDDAALNDSGAGVLRGAGEAGTNRLSPRESFSTGSYTSDAASRVSAPAPRWRPRIDVIV